MPDDDPVSLGQVLRGSLFDEPMRVETISMVGDNTWAIGLVGVLTERFRRVTLTREQLSTLQVSAPKYTYSGDAELVRLGLDSMALGIAYEYDPYFGLSISRVDPLPHQLEAVYDYLLKVATVRFLLADDAGAGKTIMAGLLLRELKLRGLAERVLVVCPANLSFQWKREMYDKFGEAFKILRGYELRAEYGTNPWMEDKQIITSLDLAKRLDVLPGLKQCRWNLVIVDEAHRMSASSWDKKSQRYRLGELLRDRTEHILLMTATPHKGDPENFSLFLQLLDKDAFANVKSIQEAMKNRRAPFYLRRTKEAMVYFPTKQLDGTWAAKKIFTKRIPKTVGFQLDDDEFQLYRDVTRFVKQQSRIAAERGEDPRSRAIGFLMSLYQRRLASSTAALRQSLENRIERLNKKLHEATELALGAPTELPDDDELEEMEEEKREELERLLEAVTIARDPQDINAEIAELIHLVEQAKQVEESGAEAKLDRLNALLNEEGFFDHPDKRLLIFTEFKDSLKYLERCLTKWNFKVGIIHGSMKPGSRNSPGTRLYVEQQFKDGAIQILVATEAAGEGINLQCCHIMINYDIPWNPNRLEQRMGRIHRYGQTKDCLIFNFVARNTVEGHVLERLLDKLARIRDALDDDVVFNVVGEVLPAAYIERVLRDYYAGKLGDADLDDRILRNVEESRFRAICQNALEGLASKKLNLKMLVERKARAQERRVVPETLARFIFEAAQNVHSFILKTVKKFPYTFEPSATPDVLREHERSPDWRLPALANKYPKVTTDRFVAEENNFEWVIPGHPLFEALRRHALEASRSALATGAVFYSFDEELPARLDVYSAKVVDGLGQTVHERLFVIRIQEGKEPSLIGLSILSNLLPAAVPLESLPALTGVPEALEWLQGNTLAPFLEEVRSERVEEIQRIEKHIDISLTELISKEDALIARFTEEAERGVEGAAGNLKQAEDRQTELLNRRERRRKELERQRSVTLQGVQRITSVIVLPHPERDSPSMTNLHPDPEVEQIAMNEAFDYEARNGRSAEDVHEQNLGYDIRSIDRNTGELRLIEVKGFSGRDAAITLTPNERRVSNERRECYWLYVVTDCKSAPHLRAIRDPAQFKWSPITKIQHFTLKVSELPDVIE